MNKTSPPKPLGYKAYGSIPHLVGSRLGNGDHHVSPGQDKICLVQTRDKFDEIIVQEKLDGSCTAVTKLDGSILALSRSGYLATTSPYEQHQLFAHWVRLNAAMFYDVLEEGERLVGEWLAQAHSTRYALTHEPWVAFDLMADYIRQPYDVMMQRLAGTGIVTPRVLHRGGPLSIDDAVNAIQTSGHGAIDPVEGAVWRVQRKGRVDFLAKYVRQDKQDGIFLPEISGKEAIWNWRP